VRRPGVRRLVKSDAGLLISAAGILELIPALPPSWLSSSLGRGGKGGGGGGGKAASTKVLSAYGASLTRRQVRPVMV
jgi:hypothetical protein